MIVDAHTHIAEAGRHGPFGLDASADALVRAMDDAGVDVSIVLPLPGVASNEFVQREAARHPARLVPLYCPDFTVPGETLNKLDRAAQRQRLHGLKIHPRVQGVVPTDPVVREVFAWASEQGVTTLVDVFPWGPSLDDERIHPLAYHRVAIEFPRLKLVLAHAGGYKVLEAFLVAKANPNVFLDLSLTFAYFRDTSVATDLAFAAGRLPAGRVLYGSDFPDVRFADYLTTVREQTAGLDAGRADALFGGTARSLYQLD